MKAGLVAAVLGILPSFAAGLECHTQALDDLTFTLCEVDATQEDLRLFHKGSDGKVLGHFSSVAQSLEDKATLAFAMNAGMYHADRSPVGLYLENGEESQRLITSAGPGNFGLLPNGVFCIGQGRADVIESMRYADTAPDCRYATQSGPMLVIDGALHPRFLVDSTSRYIRNGVGTSQDGTRVVFAISDQPVTFHEFGRLYRDVLDLPQALYFDGKVSRIYAPRLGRSDTGFWLGPIVGVVVPK